MTRFGALFRRPLFALGLLVATWAFVGTANAAVPGLHAVIKATPFTSTFLNLDAGAACPPGEQVLGAGGFIDGALGQAKLTTVTPTDLVVPAGHAAAFEDLNNPAESWRVTALAVCAEPLPGYELVERHFDVSGPAGGATAVVFCPPGKKVLGAGGHVSLPGGGTPNRVALTGFYPQDAGLRSVRATAVPDQGGFDPSWRLSVTAVCADPVAGLELVTKTTPSTSADKSINATCPSGKRVLGAGGEIGGDPGQARLDDLTPTGIADLTNVRVTAVEDQDGTTSKWLIRAHAICATP